MKTLLTLIILISSFSSVASQVDPKDITVVHFDKQQALQLTVRGDMTVKEAFEFLDGMTTFHQNRMVVKDGKRYFRYGVTLLPKNQVYLLTKGKLWTKRKLIKL